MYRDMFGLETNFSSPFKPLRCQAVMIMFVSDTKVTDCYIICGFSIRCESNQMLSLLYSPTTAQKQ
jgi:hypothetical protein